MQRVLEEQVPDYLFHAALEFRFCIEQTLRTYLELLQVEWTKPLEKMYRATQLKDAILNAEPEFETKLAFVDILLRLLHPTGVHPIDLNKLNGYYGRLGRYLHAPLYLDETAKNPEWWEELRALLFEVREYLFEVLRRPMAAMNLEGDGWDVYESWKAGALTDEEVQAAFADEFKPSDSA